MRPLHGLLLAGLALGLGACQSLPATGGRSGAAGSARLQQIVDRGALRVGMTADQAPLNMKDKRGETIGFEVDIVTALAQAMGLRLELVQRPFAELLPSLEKGEVDLVISGMTITPERNARVAFAGPYFISGKSVLSKSKAIADAQDVESLDVAGRRYVALAGSTSESFVKTLLPKATLETAADYDAAVKRVTDGKVDAMIADFPICAVSVFRHPEAKLSAGTTPLTVEPLGIALPPDAPLLLNLVQNYVATIEYTGVLTQLKARWFGDGAWVSELP